MDMKEWLVSQVLTYVGLNATCMFSKLLGNQMKERVPNTFSRYMLYILISYAVLTATNSYAR